MAARSVEGNRVGFGPAGPSPLGAGLLVLLALPVGLVAGCDDDGRPRPYQVRGLVLVDGKPAGGAKICFYSDEPWNETWRLAPSGVTDAEGRFTLRTYEPDDGAPAGGYRVTVVWPADPPASATDDEMAPRPDRLRGAAASPRTSGLTATVPVGGGELTPIEVATRTN